MVEAMAEQEQPKMDEAKKTDSPRRSRSPLRENKPPAGGSQAGDVKGPEGNGPEEKEQAPVEPPKPELADKAMQSEAQSLGRVLMETLSTASKSLLECSEKLGKNVVLLEECRADSSSIQSLAAGVNYYASTTKPSQAAAAAQHKQMSWDCRVRKQSWRSDGRNLKWDS